MSVGYAGMGGFNYLKPLEFLETSEVIRESTSAWGVGQWRSFKDITGLCTVGNLAAVTAPGIGVTYEFDIDGVLYTYSHDMDGNYYRGVSVVQGPDLSGTSNMTQYLDRVSGLMQLIVKDRIKIRVRLDAVARGYDGNIQTTLYVKHAPSKLERL